MSGSRSSYPEAYPPCTCAEFDGGEPHPWTIKGRRECRRISAVRLKRTGETNAEIATKLGVSAATVSELLREGGWRG